MQKAGHNTIGNWAMIFSALTKVNTPPYFVGFYIAIIKNRAI